MTKTRPLRADLFVEGERPRLVGSRCRETGQLFFPMQPMNPSTQKAGTMERAEIEGEGTLLNFTRVVRGMPGFDSPFALGVIELDAGPTVTAQLADWKDIELRTGMRVQLVIGPIKRDSDDTVVMGPKFRPIEGATS
jgi:uncharacterized OB-fold protein